MNKIIRIKEENKEGSEKKPRSVKAALVEEGLRGGVEGGRRGRGRGGGKKEKVDEEKTRNSGNSGKMGGERAGYQGGERTRHTHTHWTTCTEAVGPSIAYRGAKSGTAFNFTCGGAAIWGRNW